MQTLFASQSYHKDIYKKPSYHKDTLIKYKTEDAFYKNLKVFISTDYSSCVYDVA